MNVTRDVLERVGERFAFREDAFERLLRRRDRKRRNRRITAGVVGIAVFVAAIWIVTSGLPFQHAGKPAASPTMQPTPTIQPTPTPTPLVGNRQVDYLLDLETGETTQLPEETYGFLGGHNGYALSPDGSEVAYYGPGEDGGHGLPGSPQRILYSLFVARIDGTHARQVADDAVVTDGGGGTEQGPAWSPDGTKIAYTGLPSGDRNTNVFVLDLASGVITQVTFETVDVSGTQFSPDGSSIVYTALLRDGSEARIAPAIGGEGSTLVGGHGSSASAASFSPDGSLLSYICADPAFDPVTNHPWEITDLCLANADGSDPRVIARTGDQHTGIVTASWSPDGSRLAFWTFGFPPVEGVYILDLATGQTTCVAGCAGPWPPQAWPRWLDDHTLFVEAYHGPH